MRKNHVQNIIVHTTNNNNVHALAQPISQFHADVIERRLNQSQLTTEQKIAVIDKMLSILQSQEGVK